MFLEEKISNLLLRSTITAEKFVEGAVAENRIHGVEERLKSIEKKLDRIYSLLQKTNGEKNLKKGFSVFPALARTLGESFFIGALMQIIVAG